MRNLGRNLVLLRQAIMRSPEGDSPEAVDRLYGEAVNKLMSAGLKAALEGTQTDRQIQGLMAEFREAVNRKAARHLPGSAR